MSKVGQSNSSSGGGGGNQGRGGGGQGQGQPQHSRQQGLRHNQSNANSPRTSMSGQQMNNNNNKSNNNNNNNNSAKANSTANTNTTTNTNNNNAANINPNVLAELKNSISKPVRLILEDGRTETGLVWTYDLGMSVIVLEIPESVALALNRRKNESKKYFSSAIVSQSKQTPQSSSTTTNSNDSLSAKTNFEIIKLRTIQRIERLQTSIPDVQTNSTVTSNGNKSTQSQQQQQNSILQALSNAKLTPIKGDINIAAAEARERQISNETSKKISKIGIGVSKLGQDVFDSLSKTLPCRWADQHIIVMDEFVISPEKYDQALIPNVPLQTLKSIAEGKEVLGAPEEARGQATRWQRVTKVLEGERRKILASSGNQ